LLGLAINQQLNALTPNKNIHAKFLYYWSQYFLRSWIIENASATVNAAILNKSRLENAPVILPPLNEQRRIVAKIEELRERSQKARSHLSAIPNLCDKFRQSVLAAAFRGDLTADWREQNPDVEPASVLLERIRRDRRDQWEEAELERFKASEKIPKGDSWKAKYKETTGKGSRQLVAEIKAQKYRITDLPEGWTVVRLGEIAQLQTGYAFKSSWFVNEGIRLLRGTNIVPGETRWEEAVYLTNEQASEFEEYKLNYGDIVIAMDRPIISTGLKIARLNLKDIPSLLLQRVGRFKLGTDISPDFLLGLLNSQLFTAHIQDQATGTQLPHISANDIESAIIPLPPIAEQQEIAKILGIWMKKSSIFSDLVDRLFPAFEQIGRSILAKAVRGELVEQDPNDEPASVLLERIRAEREQQAQGKKGKRTMKTASM